MTVGMDNNLEIDRKIGSYPKCLSPFTNTTFISFSAINLVNFVYLFFKDLKYFSSLFFALL